jgi:secreted trypsin-like serine protease
VTLNSSGDSGGALMKQEDFTSTWYLIEIVSFGPRKCANGFPGVYLSTTSYRSWIENKINEN